MTMVLVTSVAMVVTITKASIIFFCIHLHTSLVHVQWLVCVGWALYWSYSWTLEIDTSFTSGRSIKLAEDTVAWAAAALTMNKPAALERAIANERGVSASNQQPALATSSGCSYCQRFGFIWWEETQNLLQRNKKNHTMRYMSSTLCRTHGRA